MTKSMNKLEINKLPLLDKIGYGSGNLGVGISLQIVGAYLVFFSTAVLDVPGSLIGLAISISVFIDAVTDPVMGYISDITRLKYFGRRHLYLLVGCIGLAIFNYLLWIIEVDLPTMAKFVWILVDVIMIKIFQTIYTTPYTALGAELSSDYNERTSVQGIKTIFFLLGLSFASVAGMFIFFRPTPEYPVGQLNPAAYGRMGFYASLLILVFGLVCYFTTKKYIPHLPKYKSDTNSQEGVFSLLKGMKYALGNKNYRFVVLGYMFTNISTALFGTIGLHVLTYTFALDNHGIAFIIGAQFIASILSQPLWVKVSGRMDKRPAIVLALGITLFGSVVFLVLVLLRSFVSGNFSYFIPFALMMGVGTGGLYSLPLSMIADTIDVEELNTGIRSEGTYYGCMTLLYKLSQSLAILLLGILLDLVKFDSSSAVQPDLTVMILGNILGVGMAISIILSILVYSKYDLDREKVADIQRRILEKK